MDIPATINGQPPFISGGRLRGRYLAKGLHFHWGSPNSNGSEHTINNRRYDAEMHIVHRNAKYIDIIDAAEKKDGLAVIGVLLEIVKVVYHCFLVISLENKFYYKLTRHS